MSNKYQDCVHSYSFYAHTIFIRVLNKYRNKPIIYISLNNSPIQIWVKIMRMHFDHIKEVDSDFTRKKLSKPNWLHFETSFMRSPWTDD